MKWLDQFLWWWGCWRWRPRPYAHNSELKKANEYARRVRYTLARLMKTAPYAREHHRDLLTGMVASLRTGLAFRRPRSRPGSHLRKRERGTTGARIGGPVVYEHRTEPKDPTKPVRITRVGLTEWDGETANVYAKMTRAARRHGGWVLEKEGA